jgi:hypothetical protein
MSQRLRERVHYSSDAVTVERVELLAADEVLRSIRTEYPGCAVLAKVDCEGSEYEIIRCLHEKGLLSELSIIVMEWHERGPQELATILEESGFVTLSPPSPNNGVTGMLYAVREA